MYSNYIFKPYDMSTKAVALGCNQPYFSSLEIVIVLFSNNKPVTIILLFSLHLISLNKLLNISLKFE